MRASLTSYKLCKTALIEPNLSRFYSPVKILLTDIMHRLKLKDKPFSVLSSSESDMKELWLELEQIDQSLLFNEKHRKKDLPNFPQLVQFLSHCCQVQHYSFTIKKCGVSSCSLCRPV